MSKLKIAVALSISIVLQLLLREVWGRLSYIDFPLVVVVYIALQRDAWQALVVGTLAGLIVDAAGGGLIGAGGFSKTLTAYVIYFAATRVNLENPLLRIPVLAAGGIADGRGIAAALALGAQGAIVGTRFIASNESTAAPSYRQALVAGSEDATVRTRCYTGKPARAIRNSYTSEWEAKASDIQPFPLQVMESVQRGVMDYSGRRGDADPDRTFMPAGQGLGLIHDVQPAEDIFRKLVDETAAAIGRMKPLV